MLHEESFGDELDTIHSHTTVDTVPPPPYRATHEHGTASDHPHPQRAHSYAPTVNDPPQEPFSPFTASTPTDGDEGEGEFEDELEDDDDDDDDEDESEPPHDGLVLSKKRRCTDVIFVVVFVVLAGVWGFMGYFVTFKKGAAVDRVGRPLDHEGNACGFGNFSAKSFVIDPSVYVETAAPLLCHTECPQQNTTICMHNIPTVCFTVSEATTGVLHTCFLSSSGSIPVQLPESIFFEVNLLRTEILCALATVSGVSILYLFFMRGPTAFMMYFSLVGVLLALCGAGFRMLVQFQRFSQKNAELSLIFAGSFVILVILTAVYAGVAFWAMSFGREEFFVVKELVSLGVSFILPCASVSSSVRPIATVLVAQVLVMGVVMYYCVYVLLISGLGEFSNVGAVADNTTVVVGFWVQDLTWYYPGQGVNFFLCCVAVSFIKAVASCMWSVQLCSWYTSQPMISAVPKHIQAVHGCGLLYVLRYHMGSCMLQAVSHFFLGIVAFLRSMCGSTLGPMLFAPSVFCATAMEGTPLGKSATHLRSALRQFCGSEIRNGVQTVKFFEGCLVVVRLCLSLTTAVGLWNAMYFVYDGNTIVVGGGVLFMLAFGCYEVVDIAVTAVETVPMGLLYLYILDTQQDSDIPQHYVPACLADILSACEFHFDAQDVLTGGEEGVRSGSLLSTQQKVSTVPVVYERNPSLAHISHTQRRRTTRTSFVHSVSDGSKREAWAGTNDIEYEVKTEAIEDREREEGKGEELRVEESHSIDNV